MTTHLSRLIVCVLLLQTSLWQLHAQSLPLEMNLSPDELNLITGNNTTTGFYDEAVINTFELTFSQPNYWSLLTANYASSTDLPATLTINGFTLPNPVGVRFKGQTSYSQTTSSQKKSFNISLDYNNADQDYEGYKTFNLNNCFDDPSFVREVMYYHYNRRHIPCAKANYVQLFINGENWGIYPSVQQLNKDFYKEWFMSNNGTNWRALKTTGTGGGGPGGGGGFGAGYCSLNWLGTDTTVYKGYYILKSTDQTEPWSDLVNTCYELNVPALATLPVTLKNSLDIDRALWFLAHEIIFSDDDGYAHKGGMDYYVYYEPETGRIVPQEYDGNTCMKINNASWSPFYHANDVNFALLNRLMAVPELRQRYLAHVRTIIGQSLEQTQADARIEYYYNLISTQVQNDTKKLYSFTAFNNEKNVLKNFIQTRRNNLNSNSEVNVVGLNIGAVVYSSNNTPFLAPDAGQPVNVTAAVSGALGVLKVWLYSATDYVGSFDRIEMFDDGLHNDGAAGDGVYGNTITGFPNGTRVRFYIEAIANNTPKTATYKPVGAEHDVYTYRVNISEFVPAPVVINELMASNTTTMSDEFGEYDDWVELYNTATSAMDISGWHLTDNANNLTKFTFPTGSVIPPNAYMIVWADEDGNQGNYHANFKLSADGEMLYLVRPDLTIGNEVVFGVQQTDMGYARVPNGTGDFVIQYPTFGANNNLNTTPPGVRVQAKVMLEGAYNFLTGNMNTFLLSNGLIPTSQPYNAAPFYYNGTESVSTIPANVVDWVLVTATETGGATYSKAAFLRNDGQIIDLDGSAGVVFSTGLVEGNSYLIGVKHRNHFRVLGKTAIVLPNTVAYDLTLEANVEPAGVKPVVTGVYAMVAGNCQNDKAISYADFNILNTQTGQTNYNKADLNLNAVINIADFNLYRVNAGRINYIIE